MIDVNDMYEVVITYIEKGKNKYNIPYKESIDYLKEVITTIEREYEKIEEND